MKVREEVRSFNKKAMSLTEELLNKAITPMDVLEQPETAYVLGRMMELCKDSMQLSETLAEKLDYIHDDVKKIDNSVRAVNGRIDNLSERLDILSKRLDLNK